MLKSVKKELVPNGQKKGKIGMQEGIKRWQGDGRKEQALESRMTVSSAPHTEEEKQTTKKPTKNQRQQKSPQKTQLQNEENVKVCTLSEEKVI